MKKPWIKPQLCTLKKEIFSDKEWIFEEKFDGIRCIAIKVQGKVFLYSRNHKPLNKDFPEIVASLEAMKTKDYIIDGEIVAFDGKVTSFSKLQKRGFQKVKVYYYLFDLLKFDEKNLTKLPLIERKKLLKTHIPCKGNIRYTTHIRGSGGAFLKKACQSGLEGIVAKRLDSLYLSKRNQDWLKFKCSHEQEFVIGGYTKPQGSRIGFGALLIGYYEKKQFMYAGKVGTGFDTEMLKHLSVLLKKNEIDHSPFMQVPKEKNAHFVRPTLVCEIAFTEWTDDHKLRHPRFLGLRKDKAAKSVKKE